jgi:hypothetical protein
MTGIEGSILSEIHQLERLTGRRLRITLRPELNIEGHRASQTVQRVAAQDNGSLSSFDCPHTCYELDTLPGMLLWN